MRASIDVCSKFLAQPVSSRRITSGFRQSSLTGLWKGCPSTGNNRDHFPEADLIGIGAAITRRPLPHHRAYGSVHGGSSWLR